MPRGRPTLRGEDSPAGWALLVVTAVLAGVVFSLYMFLVPWQNRQLAVLRYFERRMAAYRWATYELRWLLDRHNQAPPPGQTRFLFRQAYRPDGGDFLLGPWTPDTPPDVPPPPFQVAWRFAALPTPTMPSLEARMTVYQDGRPWGEGRVHLAPLGLGAFSLALGPQTTGTWQGQGPPLGTIAHLSPGVRFVYETTPPWQGEYWYADSVPVPDWTRMGRSYRTPAWPSWRGWNDWDRWRQAARSHGVCGDGVGLFLGTGGPPAYQAQVQALFVREGVYEIDLSAWDFCSMVHGRGLHYRNQPLSPMDAISPGPWNDFNGIVWVEGPLRVRGTLRIPCWAEADAPGPGPRPHLWVVHADGTDLTLVLPLRVEPSAERPEAPALMVLHAGPTRWTMADAGLEPVVMAHLWTEGPHDGTGLAGPTTHWGTLHVDGPWESMPRWDLRIPGRPLPPPPSGCRADHWVWTATLVYDW